MFKANNKDIRKKSVEISFYVKVLKRFSEKYFR